MSTSPTPDLTEAQRLLDAGFHLVALHHNKKRPMGNDWNTNPPLKVINPKAALSPRAPIAAADPHLPQTQTICCLGLNLLPSQWAAIRG